MHYQRKSAGKKHRRKKLLLPLAVCLVLAVPAHAAPTVTPVKADVIDTATDTTVGNAIYTDAVSEKNRGTRGRAGYYTSVTIGDGYIWRPVDIRNTGSGSVTTSNNNIMVDNLVLGNETAIDLVYFRSTAYDPDVNVYYDTDFLTQVPNKFRSLTVTKLTLNGDFTYRTGIGMNSSDLALGHNYVDVPKLAVLNNPTITALNAEGGIRLFYQIGYVNVATVEGADGVTRGRLVDFTQNPASFVGDPEKTGGTGSKYEIASFSGLTAEQATALADKLTVVGQATLMDAPLTKYLVTPGEITEVVSASDSSGTNNSVSYGMKGYTATNSGLASESVMAAADNQRALLNLHRFEDNAIFSHTQDLRLANQNRAATNRLTETPAGNAEASLWAKMYRGQYRYDSAYGRSIDQYFSTVQVGIDKEREGDFHNGKLFYGAYLGFTDSDASFQSGKSDLTGHSLGAYASWQGRDGRFLDLGAHVSRLEDSYDFTDSSGVVSRDNDYKAWNYGVNALYGYRKNLANGVYFEPQVGLSYANLGATAFTLRNGVQIRQDSQDFLTGRMGVLLGRKNGENTDFPSDIYAKVMVNHDFIGAKRSLAGFGSSTLTMEPVTKRDTWVDFSIGATKAISRKSTAYLELTRTLGGEVKTDWMVNGGLQWYWDAGPDPDRKADKPAAVTAFSTDRVEPQPGLGSRQASEEPAADAARTNAFGVDSQPGQIGETGQTPAAADLSAATVPSTAKAPAAGSAGRSAATDAERSADYTLAPVLVEAARPEWEKKLSPGTVTVVDTAKFAGEQKTLPDILQTVAGVFVQRVQGTGHYTVARVRGSTSSEVNVYIDGVLVNSAAETGVDLSLIPLENVAKVEVYRGYVPARFAGAAIGGVINIVTKKPQTVSTTIKQGGSSFGGYTGSLETVAPLGDGTLLFNLSRDQARGDFDYHLHPQVQYENEVDQYGPDRTRQYNYYRNTSAMLKWQDDNWFAKFQYDRKNTGIPNGIGSAALIDLPALSRGYRYMITDKYRLQVGRRQTDGNLEWGWKLNYEDNDKRARCTAPVTKWTPAGVKYSNFDNNVYGASVDGSWRLGNHMLEFLFDYSKETIDVSASYWGNLSIVPANSTRKWLTHYDIKNYYYQIQDNISLDRHKSLLLSPIFRAQKMEMNTFTDEEKDWQYSYGIGLKKTVRDGLALRATYGTYNKAPNFYEMFGDGGMFIEPRSAAAVGGDVTWEHGDQYDFGVDWRGRALGADADMSLTYFNRHVENLTAYYITHNGTAMYTNFGEGKIDGVEYEGRFKWKNWEFEQTVTYNNSTLTKQLGKYGTKEDRDQPFANIPKWETNTRLTYNLNDKKTAVMAELHYLDKVVTDYNTDNTEMAWYDSLTLVNLAVKHKFNPGFNLTVGVNDIGNKGPKQLAYWGRSYTVPMPQQGRTYYVTAQYTF